MSNSIITIESLQGFAGIQLDGNRPLEIKKGLNLLVGRNGSGKSNLLKLIQACIGQQMDLRSSIESNFVSEDIKRAFQGVDKNIQRNFGEKTVATFQCLGIEGSIRLRLKDITEVVLDNVSRGGPVISGIDLHVRPVPMTLQQIQGNNGSLKFEMAGFVNANVLSREPNNPAHTIMEGPILTVSNFVREKMTELYQSQEFVLVMKELEESINTTFTKFLGNTRKTVKVNYDDISRTGHVFLSLMDGGNYVQSSDLSAGELNLLNLIFSLIKARSEKTDLLTLDEPDIHMHEDMVQVLVDELESLSLVNPDCVIIIVSHSTAMIEKLSSLGKDKLNLIIFDNEKKVSNSQNDVDLINALERNGVRFSPLMISKKCNIFIENRIKSGEDHRDLLLKFFKDDNVPNVIPIGTSGNVQDSKSFMSIIEEIFKVSGGDSYGIQDGDIWFKHYLKRYLIGEQSLEDIIAGLQEIKGAYFQDDSLSSNIYYFNFWEIENLYLFDETLIHWRKRNGETLNRIEFNNFLKEERELIFKQYLKTFGKLLVNVKIENPVSFEQVRDIGEKKLASIQLVLSDVDILTQRLYLLIDAVLSQGLLHWLPGKEVKNLLKGKGYHFQFPANGFSHTTLGDQLQAILSKDQKVKVLVR